MSKTVDIKELVKRLREGKFARLQIAGPYPDQYVYAVDTEKTHLRAADALEALAGENERLKDAIEYNSRNCIDTMNKMHEQHTAERDRLKAALTLVRDATEGGPDHVSDDDIWAIHDAARKALEAKP